MKKALCFTLLLPFILWAGPPGQKYSKVITDTKGHEDRRVGIASGNLIRTRFNNSGSIGGPGDRNKPRIEWPAYSGHEYGYELGPLIGAQVMSELDTLKLTKDSALVIPWHGWGIVQQQVEIPTDTGVLTYDEGDTIRTDRSVRLTSDVELLIRYPVFIVADGIQDGGDEDFEPLPGYANPNPPPEWQGWLAFSDKPETWPPTWPDGSTEWPGQFGKGRIIADQESYWVMTDEACTEFMDEYGPKYYPDPNNLDLHGLGIQVECRHYQWAAAPAQDIIFFIYKVKNISAKRIENMVFGFFGDYDIGGYPDYGDDLFGFDRSRNMVYSWDSDNQSVNFEPGENIGWLGLIFLDSPGNDKDGIDNDGDGMIDESQYNGIDDDGDWDATDEEAAADPNDVDGKSDDVGADGIPNTGDYGEGDGVPTPGEPDFEWMDFDEKDRIGLTSCKPFLYGAAYAIWDSVMYAFMKPGTWEEFREVVGDFVSVFGSGYTALDPGEEETYSVAIVVGADSADLFQNADMALQIYRLNYQFARPPTTPTLRAFAGDGYVVLYWDDVAEYSVDNFLGYKDFEGYKLYKGMNRNTLTWGEPITDAYGRQVGVKPLEQWDLVDGIKGYSPIEVEGYHFYLGDDKGIVHMYVDSNVINGMTYYYAITAYDRGDTATGLPPLETPITLGGINVVKVVPQSEAAGYVAPEVDTVEHISGFGTGEFIPIVLDPSAITEDKCIMVEFDTVGGDTVFSAYEMSGDSLITLFKNCPYIYGEDAVPVVYGMRIRVRTEPIERDFERSGWIAGDCHWGYELTKYDLTYPADYMIYIQNTVCDTDYFGTPVTFRVYNLRDSVWSSFVFFNVLGPDSTIEDGDKIVPLVEVSPGVVRGTWQVEFKRPPDTILQQYAPDTLPPGRGMQDVFLLATHKPFDQCDRFMIKLKAPSFSVTKAKDELDRIKVVPNPYVVAAAWEPEVEEPTMAQRAVGAEHRRKICFIHLPPKCTIRIFTLSGELVKVIEHDSDTWDGMVEWDMISKDGMEIAYGIYFYVVDVPGVGTKMGKFAVVK